MSIYDEHASGLEEFEAEAGETCVISGTTYACTASVFSKGRDLEDGGWAGDFDVTLTLRTALFVTVPTDGATVTFKTKSFRAVKVHLLPGAAVFRLFLSAANK